MRLAADGYDVRVIATRHEPWATETDRDVASRRPWKAEAIDYRRGAGGATYWRTGARYRAARAIAASDRARAQSRWRVVSRAFGRVHTELVRAIVADPGDLIYGGTTGALAAIAEAARALEDAVCRGLRGLSQRRDVRSRRAARRCARRRVWSAPSLRGAAFVTTSSEAIAVRLQRAATASDASGHPQHVPASGRSRRMPRVDLCAAARVLVQPDDRARPRARGCDPRARPRGHCRAPGAARTPAARDTSTALIALASAHAPRVEVVHLRTGAAGRDGRLRARIRRRPGARADDAAQPATLPDEQGVHLHPRRHGGRDDRHAGAARARRRSRPRGGAGARGRCRRAGGGVRRLGGQRRRSSIAPSGPPGTRRRAAGTGNTSWSAERSCRWSARRWREDPAADGSVHQGAAGSLRRHRTRRRRSGRPARAARPRRHAVGGARVSRERHGRAVRP